MLNWRMCQKIFNYHVTSKKHSCFLCSRLRDSYDLLVSAFLSPSILVLQAFELRASLLSSPGIFQMSLPSALAKPCKSSQNHLEEFSSRQEGQPETELAGILPEALKSTMQLNHCQMQKTGSLELVMKSPYCLLSLACPHLHWEEMLL